MEVTTQLRTLVPRPIFEKLIELDAESEEFERTFRQFYASRESPDDETVDDPTDLVLLPFAGFENYSLDAWGRPHGVGVQGQKRGPLTAIKQWKPPSKGRKARFAFGYRLYRDGKRVYQSALQCAIARLNAETAPKKAQYLAGKDRKTK
jgi:hypothetical protein